MDYTRKVTYIVAIVLLFGFGYCQNIQFEIESGNIRKSIPLTKQCSCELVVFPLTKQTYNITLKNLNRDIITNIYIKLQISGLEFNETPDGTQLSYNDIQVAPYIKKGKSEITEHITVRLYKGYLNTLEQFDCQQRKVYFVINQEESYSIDLPEYAIAVTQVFAFLIMVVLCQNIKYRRFVPIRFGFPFAIAYSSILFLVVYISIFIKNQTAIASLAFWSVMLFSGFCMVIYLIDIASIFMQSIKIIIATSMFLALCLILVDTLPWLLEDAWFINNIIAILVAGACIKFVVVKKLKASILPLAFLWVFFILRQFSIVFHIQDFEQAMQIKIVPLFLQIPYIISDETDGYVCSAFGTSKIITMGLILNYCVRVDLFLSTNFYKIVTIIIAFLCLSFEILLQILLDELPVMEYFSIIIFLPLSLLIVLLLSAKRGQWAQIYHGSFHDMAVDRYSVRKESGELTDEYLNRNLGSLVINPSQLIQSR